MISGFPFITVYFKVVNMRNKKLYSAIISLLTAIVITFILTFSTFAAQEPVVSDPYVETYVEEEPYIPQETQAPQVPEDEYDDYDDGDDGYDEGGYVEEEQQQQEEPQPTYYEQYSEELPQVESQEVVKPTTVVLPDVEVTDTSLLGGVIAWLCVAVGIAVIAGVLVSQRTRQSSGQRRN